MANLNLPPSEEGRNHAIEELVLADDWDTMFVVDVACAQALEAELNDATNPDRMIELQKMHRREQRRIAGYAAIRLLRENVVAELEAFEAEFGNR